MRAAIDAQGRWTDVLVVCKSPAGYNNAIVVVGGRFQGGYEGTDFG